MYLKAKKSRCDQLQRMTMVIHQSIQKSKHKSLAEFEVEPLVIYSMQKTMMNQHVLKHINFYLECDKVFF